MQVPAGRHISTILTPLFLHERFYSASCKAPFLEQKGWQGRREEGLGALHLPFRPLRSRKIITREEDRETALFVFETKAMSFVTLLFCFYLGRCVRKCVSLIQVIHRTTERMG